MQLTAEEKSILTLLNEVSVREPLAKARNLAETNVQHVIDNLLFLGLIEEIELPPHSGKRWYVHTVKVTNELLHPEFGTEPRNC